MRAHAKFSALSWIHASTPSLRLFPLMVLAFASIVSPARASWSQFNVCQVTGIQYGQQATTDGSGGAIVAWYDNRSGSGAVYAQHVLASDVVDPAWPVNGRLIGSVGGDPTIAIASDGAGGAIVAWVNDTGSDIYAHHVLASGVVDPAWPSSGVPVCTAPNNQGGVRAVSDGAGGAILTWTDDRNPLTSENDIYAQRVLSTGVVAPTWPANGVGVCTEVGSQSTPVAVSDGSGGIIISWDDYRNDNDYDVYAQRLLPTGAVASGWPAGGQILCGASDDQGAPRICTDGAGGAIVAWADYRSGNDNDIYVMRVRSTGALGQGWTHNGELVCNATNSQEPFDLVADGSGGAVLSWYDRRAGDGFADIYVQRLTASGTMSWTANGVAVCTAADYQNAPSLGSDGAGGVYVAWQDQRHTTTTELYLHHVLASGMPDPTWPADGGRVTFGGGVQYGANFEQPILTNGSGSATVFWAGADVFALNITPTWTPFYALQVSATPPGTGSVTKNPDANSYAANSTVTLTAVPATGYGFVAWSGDASGSTNPLVVTMNASKTITANFAGYAVNVAAAPTGGGSVARNPDQPTYAPGSQVTLTATPGTGYAFANWSGDASGTTNPLIVTVDANKSITANFVGYAVNVASAPTGGGSVTKNPNQTTYAPGSQVTLTATPGTGYAFTNWSGDASGTTNPLMITVDGPKAVTANFVGYPVNMTIVPSGSGTVNKSPNQATYAPGSQVTLTASNSPFPFLGWSGDASGTTNPLVVTVTGPKNITASFLAYTVTTAAAPANGGGISRAPDQTAYAPGATVSLTATPIEGLGFSGWSGDATGTNNPLSLLVDGNKNVTANFSVPTPACGAWTLVASATSPSPRGGMSVAWDPVRHRTLVFGGWDGTNFLNEVWQLTAADGWSQLTPAGTPPSPRDVAGMVYEPTGDRLIVFGGNNSGGFGWNDVWQLTLTGTPTWSLLSPTGTAPNGRYEFSTIHDSVRNQMVVFAGINGGYLNDTWVLSLTGTPSWSQLSPAGSPPPGRHGHVAIYDPVRDRMLIQGGQNGTSVFSDLWALSLGGTPTWSQLTPSGQPPQRFESAAIYDPIRDRMMVVAGKEFVVQGGTTYDEVWSLSLEVVPMWRKLNPGGTPLGARFFFNAVHEPDLDLLVAIGGYKNSVTLRNDAKRLDCAGGWWLETGATNGNGNVTATPNKLCYGNDEVVNLQAVGQGSYVLYQWLGDASGANPSIDVTMNDHKTIVAQFSNSPVGVEETPSAFALGAIHPNPTTGMVRIECSLAHEAAVSLRVFDVAGREVATLLEGVQAAGPHTVTWDGRRSGGPARSGVYLIRYETSQRMWSRRIALIR